MPVWLNWLLLAEMLLICVPNFLVILVTIKVDRLRRNVGNMFILAFALNDFVTGLVVIPLGLIHEIEYAGNNRGANMTQGQKDEATVGEAFCDLLQTSINYTGMLSVWFMALIAGDRYYRIAHENYKKWMTCGRAAVTIVLFHVGVLLSTLIFWISHKVSGLEYEESQCVIYITYSIFTFGFATVFGFFPFFFMLYYYIKLVQMSHYEPRDEVFLEEGERAGEGQAGGGGGGCCCCGCACGFVILSCNRNSKRTNAGSEAGMMEMKETTTTVASGTSRMSTSSGSAAPSAAMTRSLIAAKSGSQGDGQEANGCISSNRLIRNRMRKQSRKARQLIRLIVYAYCCCVFPPFFVYLIFTFGKSYEIDKSLWIYAYPWLTFLNSAINPFIYFFISKEARSRTIQWLRKRFSF